MGDFFGHSMPGTFFFLVGLWWMVNTYARYFNSLRKNASPYASTLTFPVRALRCCAHIDAIIILLMCSAGMIVELVLAPAFRTEGKLPMELVQHATMYFFFGLYAMTVLMTSRMTSRLGGGLKQLQYVTFAIALTVEAMLFKFHLYGRNDIDTMLHNLLVYAVCGGAISCFLEMTCRSSLLLSMARVFFILLQGSWFWQVSFFLYKPFSFEVYDTDYQDEQTAHDKLMLVACAFAWHMAAIIMLMLLTGACMSYRYRGTELNQSLAMNSRCKAMDSEAGGLLDDEDVEE